MKILLIHGVHKHPLDISDQNTSTSSVESEQDKNRQQQDEPWTLSKLKKEIERLTGVPMDGQRLIRKGATLFGDDTLLSTLNFIEGEKIMVLGQKPPELVEDPSMKSLTTIDKTVLDGIENKLKEIDERLRGIQQGFLPEELVTPSLKDTDKQLKLLGEDCMKTLELMDAMCLSDEAHSAARAKRKSLVVRVQALLRWYDDLVELKEQIASDSGRSTGGQVTRVTID